jgi:predicted transcriptional regulator
MKRPVSMPLHISTAIAHSPTPRPTAAKVQHSPSHKWIAHMNQDKRSLTIYLDPALADQLQAQALKEDRALSYIAVRELRTALTNMVDQPSLALGLTADELRTMNDTQRLHEADARTAAIAAAVRSRKTPTHKTKKTKR